MSCTVGNRLNHSLIYYKAMTAEQELSQLQAKARMMEKLHRAGQVSALKLERIQEELRLFESRFLQNHDQNDSTEKPEAEEQNASEETSDVSHEKPKKSVVEIQMELTQAAEKMRQEQAKLSNTLHLIDPGVNCLELVENILDLRSKIEGVWTRKKMIERGLDLAKEETPDEQAENIEEKNKLTILIRRLTDKKSKLRKKLDDLRQPEKKRVKWQIELVETEALLAEAKTNRDLL